MDEEEFEIFNEKDDEWLSELEIRATNLEHDIAEWRESRARELTETGFPSGEAVGQGTRAFRAVNPDGQGDGTGQTSVIPAARRPANGARRTRADNRARPVTRTRPEAQPRSAQRLRPEDAAGTGQRPRPAQDRPECVVPDQDQDQDESYQANLRAEQPAAPAEDQDARSWADDPWPGADASTQRRQALIERGRASAGRRRRSRGFRITVVTAGLLAAATILVLVFAGGSASWPASVTTVKAEIATACQNSNVASEPGQVNFACGKNTQQILWVFALMTSNDNPNYSDAKTGREGLEPITPTEGGDVAWSLDLHEPYNPLNPVDSLEVAARAINNIVGGATLTNSKGKPTVQAGLESSPSNCAQYTGSSAVVSRAGFPDVCAQPVSTLAGQAALAADVYQEWVVGATSQQAQEVAVLFENANNPGNAQVQAILKTLPGAA